MPPVVLTVIDRGINPRRAGAPIASGNTSCRGEAFLRPPVYLGSRTTYRQEENGVRKRVKNDGEIVKIIDQVKNEVTRGH